MPALELRYNVNMRVVLAGLGVALLVACTVLDSVGGYEGPPRGGNGGTGGGGTDGGGATGGSIGDATTTDAKCVAPADCDDHDPCTDDSCWGGLCTYAPKPGASCSDGNACNGEEACDATGACKPGTPLVVDDGNPCTDDSCDPVKGVSHTPQDNPPKVILQCGNVVCPTGYFLRKLTCLTECGACDPTFCVNGSICERVCEAKMDVCCNNACGDDCPPGYTQTATSLTGDCGCGPGNTATCQR